MNIYLMKFDTHMENNTIPKPKEIDAALSYVIDNLRSRRSVAFDTAIDRLEYLKKCLPAITETEKELLCLTLYT